jgi:MFS transporter, MCT family, solute carrier family 16 (monocarboxylic acid transporters), member 14
MNLTTSMCFCIRAAAFVTLRSIVIANLLGVNKLNNAYGLLSLCQGIAVIIGSPLSGWLRTYYP